VLRGAVFLWTQCISYSLSGATVLSYEGTLAQPSEYD